MRCAYCALHGLGNGEFREVGEFVDTIEHYITVHNKDHKPFVRNDKANDILQKVIVANGRLDSKQLLQTIVGTGYD
jgi:hypothetical protein